jgi:hypothetical protein
MTTKADKKAGKKPKTSGRRGSWLFLSLVMVLAAAFLPMAAVIFCGMLPTAIAYMTDRDPHKHAALTVGGLNFCGVAPFMIALWQKGNSMDAALSLLAHPVAWLVMLGGAGLGWMIYFSVPPAVAAVVVRLNQAKAAGLEERKKKLADLWDPPLAGSPSPQNGAPAMGQK